MALQRPFNINVRGQTYDAEESIKVNWQVSGDTSVAYQVRILNNSDNSLSYDSTKLTSYALTHTIPAMSLVNGLEYKVQITIWNSQNASISSDYEIFETSARPVVVVPTIGTIANPSYEFTANYSQAQSIGLRSWIVFLYDVNQIKIAQSPIITSSTISYTFNNMQSNEDYYIEFQATSDKGMVGTSGKISFTVSYTQPLISVNLEAENIDNGGIKLKWDAIQIIGQTENSPIFINGEKLDVRNDTFSFSEGFLLPNNFTMKIWIENIKRNVDLITLYGDNGGKIRLQYWNDYKFHLFKEFGGLVSHYASAYMAGRSFFLCIKQVYDDMDIIGEVIDYNLLLTYAELKQVTYDELESLNYGRFEY